MFPISLNVSLCESEIDEEYFVGSFVESDTEVVGLYVSVNEVSVVHILNS